MRDAIRYCMEKCRRCSNRPAAAVAPESKVSYAWTQAQTLDVWCLRDPPALPPDIVLAVRSLEKQRPADRAETESERCHI
eukprot:41576-Eustigmatos_ZCMA.PRE.1